MILAENTDNNIVKQKNAINKMVNQETAAKGLKENNLKGTFQYAVPRVRASFTLKVAPDSITADLPEPSPTNELANLPDLKDVPKTKLAPKLGPKIAKLPCYEPESPLYDPPMHEYRRHRPEFRPRIPAKSPIENISRTHKPSFSHRSNYNFNDDKDFEIPLEESLKAVEDFIQREKELAKWQIGEVVLAKWKGNGLYYKAKILEIFVSGLVVINFDSYNVTEEIIYMDLCKFCKKTNNFKKKGSLQPKLTSDTTKNNQIYIKKQLKIKKRNEKSRRHHFVTMYKRADKLRKKFKLSCYNRSHVLHNSKRKFAAQTLTATKLN